MGRHSVAGCSTTQQRTGLGGSAASVEGSAEGDEAQMSQRGLPRGRARSNSCVSSQAVVRSARHSERQCSAAGQRLTVRERAKSTAQLETLPRCVRSNVFSARSDTTASAPSRFAGTLSPQCAAQISSLEENLRDAALALRRIVSQPAASSARTCGDSTADSKLPAAKCNVAWPAERHTVGHARLQYQATHEKQKAKSTPDAAGCSDPSAAATALAAMTTEKLLVPTIERLAAENVALREACAEANERLAQLEEEKQRFLDEGVFDLVNSVCGKNITAHADGISCNGRSLLCGSSIAAGSPGGAVDSAIGLQALFDTAEPAAAAAADADATGVASSTGAASLPPDSGAESPLRSELEVHTQLSPEDIRKRSEELSGENERLRHELACSGKYGETLQLEQQAVEDHMHALEQEHLWLAHRLQESSFDGQNIWDSNTSVVATVDGEVLPRSRAHLFPQEAGFEAATEAGAHGPRVRSCGSPHQSEQILENSTVQVFEHSPSQIETSQQPPG